MYAIGYFQIVKCNALGRILPILGLLQILILIYWGAETIISVGKFSAIFEAVMSTLSMSVCRLPTYRFIICFNTQTNWIEANYLLSKLTVILL